MSHEGDHSGFYDIFLGREKSSGGEENETEDYQGDQDGFAEISCEWVMIVESNSM